MSTKPEYVKPGYITPYADGMPLRRLQDYSITGDFGTEDHSELGNTNFVETTKDTPEFTVSFTEKFVGNLDNFALLADQFIPYTADSDAENRATSSQYGYDVVATPNASTRTITQLNILDAYCDLSFPYFDSSDESSLFTCFVHRAALTGVSGSFDVSGAATLTYNLTGAERHFTMNDWSALRNYVFRNKEILFDSAGGATQTGAAMTFKVSTVALPNGATPVGFYFDRHAALLNTTAWSLTQRVATADHIVELRYLRGDTFKATPWATTGSGTSTKVNMYYIVSGVSSDGTKYDSYKFTSNTTSKGAITRAYYDLKMWNSSHTSSGYDSYSDVGTFERVQSLSFDISPEVENLYQMGDKNLYAVERRTPVPITGTISLFTSDLEPFLMACGLLTTSRKIIDETDYNGALCFQLDCYKDENKINRTASFKFTGADITNDLLNIAADSRGNTELTFKATDFVASSTGVNPNE